MARPAFLSDRVLSVSVDIVSKKILAILEILLKENKVEQLDFHLAYEKNMVKCTLTRFDRYNGQ